MKRKKKCCDDEQHNKKTQSKRPDVSRKKQEEKYYNRSVIKCTLGPLCNFAVVRKEIEETVFWMSRLQIHTHHLMTLYLSESKGILPGIINAADLYGFWNTCYRHLANCLTNAKPRKDKNEELFTLCQNYVQRTNMECSWPEKCFGGWRGKLLEQMAKQSATVHKTHLDTNLYIYATRYLRFLIDTSDDCEDMTNLKRQHYNMMFSAICSAFERRIRVSEVVLKRPKTLQFLPEDHSIWKTAQALLDILTSLVPEKCSVSKKSEIAYFILSQLEDYVKTVQAKFLAGDYENSGRHRNTWLFALCPQMEWRPKHIHISSTALRTMLKDLGKEYTFMNKILEDPNDTNVWSAVFDLKRVLRNRHQVQFGNFIYTDGVGVSCVIQKRKNATECRMIDLQTKISKIKKDNVQDDPQIDVMMRELKTMKNNAQKNPEDIPGYVKDMLAIKKQDDTFITQCKVIGLDPGKRNAATWVHHDPEKQRIHNQWKKEQHTKPEERFKSGCLTGNQWIYESGQKQYTKKMKKRMDVMVPEWRSMRTTKTVNTDALMEVYAFQIHLWPQIHQAFFAEKWFAKMRMRRFCKKQKALDDVVTRITGTKQKDEQKKVVIAYGNGVNQATLRGTQSMMSTTLATKLKRCCTVVFVDEFRTSANCSCCHEEMKQKNYRVKWCINTSCTRSLWNRDINASINILLLFLQECHDGSRSQRFKRENRL